MGFFKSWLNKRKEKKLEERFEEISEGVLLEEDKSNSSKVEHYVIERLEQVVEATREIEDEKSEYRVVTAYLNDIHTIGGLPEKERAAITDVAQNIVNLDRARQEFLHSEKKISDVQYTAIQQEENTVPNTIKRLKANEAYQEILEKDMKYLVRERDEWLFYKEELLNEEKSLQNNVRLVTGLGICSGVLLLLYQFATDASMKLIWTVYLFIMAAAICTLALKIMNAQKDYQRATKNADKAIQLLNTVKLKYVSVTNAVDYCREKFHVNSAGEFNRIWEAYLEAVKQREKFEINNDDLRYYNNRLIRMLSEYKLYDAKVWIPQALALVDHNEMVEVTHRLNERRQKIRGRIEKSVEMIKRHVEDMEKLLPDLSPEVAAQVKNIMMSIEKLGVTR
ncbi:MAG: hypothetical protein IKU69_00120 [Roseburia sp.]|nr:hypothetical protein [Roseburia sp.]